MSVRAGEGRALQPASSTRGLATAANAEVVRQRTAAPAPVANDAAEAFVDRHRHPNPRQAEAEMAPPRRKAVGTPTPHIRSGATMAA